MKKRIYFSIILTCLLFTSKITIAQDFHLSHYDANPLYINPALTGMNVSEDWGMRINANYREQGGNSFSSANTTMVAGLDKILNPKFSLGGFVIDNKSMYGIHNTINMMLSGSYKIIHDKLDGNSPHNLSVGLQLGILYKSLNPADFTYDSQYSASSIDGFDKNIPSGENYNRESLFRIDANLGIFYRYYNKNKKLSPFGGFSIYHLTQPDESYTGQISRTQMRFVLHGGCYYYVNNELTIMPQLLYMNQAKSSELNAEVLGFYKITDTDYQPMAGISWRNKDAMVFHAGLKYKNNIFRISYDSHISYLKYYTNGRAGLELSVIYTISKKVKSHF